MNRTSAAALAGYIGTIFAANWAISTFGVIPVGFGLMAPAGVFFAGLALSLRDAVQETAGRRWVLAGVLAGAALSAALSGPLALASGAAFLVSELADFAIYTPLRSRTWAGAVALSNTVGAVIDSALFLWLAFGSLDFLPGQVWAKVLMTVPAIALVALWRSQRASAAR